MFYIDQLLHFGVLKGFAFVNYHHKEDAARAIQALNGYGYDHLILSVEWARLFMIYVTFRCLIF